MVFLWFSYGWSYASGFPTEVGRAGWGTFALLSSLARDFGRLLRRSGGSGQPESTRFLGGNRQGFMEKIARFYTMENQWNTMDTCSFTPEFRSSWNFETILGVGGPCVFGWKTERKRCLSKHSQLFFWKATLDDWAERIKQNYNPERFVKFAKLVDMHLDPRNISNISK